MDLKETICLSVIVPVYNAESFLDECIDSLKKQILTNIEIIIVDDGSTDNSVDVVRKQISGDKRIKLITQNNYGAGCARNVGLQQAQGEYVMFFDPDDRLSNPNALIRLCEAAIENNQLLVCGTIKFFAGHVSYKPSIYKCHQEGYVSLTEISHFFGHTRFIYSRRFLNDYHLNYPEIRAYEDPVFLAKVFEVNNGYYAIDEVVYDYRKAYKSVCFTLDVAQDYLQGIDMALDVAKKSEMVMAFKHTVGCLNYFPLLDAVFKDPDRYSKILSKIKIKIEEFRPFLKDDFMIPCVFACLSDSNDSSFKKEFRRIKATYQLKHLLYKNVFGREGC